MTRYRPHATNGLECVFYARGSCAGPEEVAQEVMRSLDG